MQIKFLSDLCKDVDPESKGITELQYFLIHGTKIQGLSFGTKQDVFQIVMSHDISPHN